jgi:hypothetical protein
MQKTLSTILSIIMSALLLLLGGTTYAQDINTARNNLKILVLIPEVIIRRVVPDPAAETEVQRALITNGFRVLDIGQTDKLRAREEVLGSLRANGLSNGDIVRLGARFKADLFVTGEAFAEEIVPNPPEFARAGLRGYQARLELKVIDLATGQLAFSNAYTATGVGLVDSVAGKQALENAAKRASVELPQWLNKWLVSFGSGRTFAVVVNNAPSYGVYSRLISTLKTTAGINSVNSRQFDNVSGILDVQYAGPIEQLADILLNAGLEVDSVSGGEIRASFQKTTVLPPPPPPARGTVNGYTTPGQYIVRFNVSAFDASGAAILSGRLQSPFVTGISAGLAQASVCGDITNRGALTASVILDASGSMNDNDPERMRLVAAQQFVSRLSGNDVAAVSAFGASIQPTNPFLELQVMQNFTNNRSLLNSAVTLATTIGNRGTPLYDTLFDSARFLAAQPGANKITLIMTDGLDDKSKYKTPDDAVNAALAAGTRIFAIGLQGGNPINFNLLRDIAQRTGGTFAEASNPNELQNLFGGMINAGTASGCVEVRFVLPSTNATLVSGQLNFDVVTAFGVSRVAAPFSVQVP